MRKLANTAFKSGITIHMADTIPYKQLSERAVDPATIRTMHMLLCRVHTMTKCVSPPTEDTLTDITDIQKFMAAYMIMHTNGTHVFEYMGLSEKNLLAAARSMISMFEGVCSCIRERSIKSDITAAISAAAEFLTLLSKYYNAFDTWKTVDTYKERRRIEHLMNSLYEADELLPNGCIESHLLHKRFYAQRHVLRIRLVMVVGDVTCVTKTENRLSEARIRRCKVYQHDDANGQASWGCVPQHWTSRVDKPRGDVLLPLASYTYGSPCAESSRIAAGDSDAVTVATAVAIALISPVPAGVLVPPWSGVHIVRELLTDASFSIRKDGNYGTEHSSIENIRCVVNGSFFRSVEDELLLTPPCYTRLLMTLRELHVSIYKLQNVTSVYANGPSRWSGLKSSIDRVFDMASITRHVNQGSFTWSTCSKLVNGILNALQSHAPDTSQDLHPFAQTITLKMQATNTDAMAQPRVLCHILVFMHKYVHTERTTNENVEIDSVRDFVASHGIESQRLKNSKAIFSGELHLQNTRTWLRNTMQHDNGDWLCEFATANNRQCKMALLTGLLAMGMVNIVCASSVPISVDVKTFPETFLPNVHSIRDMRLQVNMYVVTSAVLSVVSTWRDQHPLKPMDMNKLGKILLNSTLFSTDINGVVSLTMKHVKTSEDGLNALDYCALQLVLSKTLQTKNSDKLVVAATTVRKLLLFGLKTKAKQDDMHSKPMHTMAMKLLPPANYSSIAPRIYEMVARVRKMVEVNLKIFGVQYSELVIDEVADIFTSHL
ncbi:hypothetical protein T484DRAFT_1757506 [Baffinella frigidus]|nr:hypothetical protein T484DRAFT_1757506 [Cryptophyta sp. CCMP2293]